MKLFDNTIKDLKRAICTEGACVEVLKNQIKDLQIILNEEQIQRDDLKGLSFLQKKQIETLNIKHNRNTDQLERNLSNLNEHINQTIKQGYIKVKQLERNTNNMVAAQQS